MVIDTSAVLAILQREPECATFARAVADAPTVRMSAVNYVECATVIESRLGAAGGAWFDSFLADSNITIVQVDTITAKRARGAYAIYGKGRHRAGLNLADVFAYALAKEVDEPLLFKGDDFSHTDIAAAL